MGAPRFAADPGSSRKGVRLDGLDVLFHRQSGMTHIVAPPAGEILDALNDGPASVQELVDWLSSRFELAGDNAVAAVRARIEELECAGLVRRL
jgi:PqqD family protein of HPr-rel-A system